MGWVENDEKKKPKEEKKGACKKTKLTTTEGTQHVIGITSFILQNLPSQRLLLKDRIPIDSLLKPRQSLINTHLTILLLTPPLPTFRWRKPRRSTKSAISTITL
jgi:hypothetical protein